MPSMLDIARAIQKEQDPIHRSVLLYGDPKSGKTHMAATLAKVPSIKSIDWFDLENGSETIATMWREGFLTDAEIAKIRMFKLPDTPDFPVAFETLPKLLTVPKAQNVCEQHGRIGCAECTKAGYAFQLFDMRAKGEHDWVVIDSGSQFSDSILNYAKRGKPEGFKPGWDEYGFQGMVLSDCLTVIQQARFCNFLVVTHVISTEGDDKRERFYPLIGTKNFSCHKAAKYFGHVIFLNIETKKHKAGSSSVYKTDAVTGSRSGWVVEKEDSVDFSLLFERLQQEKTVSAVAVKK